MKSLIISKMGEESGQGRDEAKNGQKPVKQASIKHVKTYKEENEGNIRKGFGNESSFHQLEEDTHGMPRKCNQCENFRHVE